MTWINEAELDKMQKAIAAKMMVIVKKCDSKKLNQLAELNAMLDSLNRAAYYLMKPSIK